MTAFSTAACTNPVACNSPGLALPIHQYNTGANCTVVGGYNYRGCAIPDLDGTYFFADYCSGRIWSFEYDGVNQTNFQDRTAELRPSTGAIGRYFYAYVPRAANGRELELAEVVARIGEVARVSPALAVGASGHGQRRFAARVRTEVSALVENRQRIRQAARNIKTFLNSAEPSSSEPARRIASQ